MTDETPTDYRASIGNLPPKNNTGYPLAPHNLIDMTKGECAWLKLNPENIQPSQSEAMRDFANFDWRQLPRATGIKVIDRNLEVLIDECVRLGDAFSRMTIQALKMRKSGSLKADTLDVVFGGWQSESGSAEALIDYVFDADLTDGWATQKAEVFAKNLATQQFKAAVARQLAKCMPL